MSAEAENCLLKTLEEPPPHALMVVTAEDAEALLPTTVSRCRQIRLRPVATAVIAEHLAARCGVPDHRARLLAALAEGRPGWAISAASEPGRLETYHGAIERLEQTLASGKRGRLAMSRRLAEGWPGKSEQVREELRVWAGWWRDLLHIRLGLPVQVAHVHHTDDLQRRAEQYSTAELRAALGTLVQVQADLDQNANPRLALDVALLKLPALAPASARSSPGHA